MQQSTKKEEKQASKDEKLDMYVPMNEPYENRAPFNRLLPLSARMLPTIAYGDPTLKESRDDVEENRIALKEHLCSKCIHLNQFKVTDSKPVARFEKDDNLSEKYKKIVKTKMVRYSSKSTMACAGCRVLRLKQIATGFIKGHRIKFV